MTLGGQGGFPLAPSFVALRQMNTVVLTSLSLYAKMLFRGCFFMRCNSHNSRKGTGGGVIGVKHNDRDFDYTKAEHIDDKRVKSNEYIRYQQVGGNTLDEYEQAFYEQNFGIQLSEKNVNAIMNRHPDRVMTMEKFRKSVKTCPEESIFTVGNAKEPIPPNDLMNIYNDFIEWHQKEFPNCVLLDAALHLDESNPHIHWRKVWVCHDSGGNLRVHQNNALAEMGIERPNLNKPSGRYNNAKITYTNTCHAKQIEIARRYGYDITAEPQAASKQGRALEQYKYDSLVADNKALKAEKKSLEGAVLELKAEVGTLTEDKEQLVGELKELTEQTEQAHEMLLKATNAPPRPQAPPPKPKPYDEWKEEFGHDLQNYQSLRPFDTKGKQEKRRKAEYADKVERYEKAVKACDEWDNEWGLVQSAQKVLGREERLDKREKRLLEREQHLDERIKIEVHKAVKGHSETIEYLENRLLENGIEPFPAHSGGIKLV